MQKWEYAIVEYGAGNPESSEHHLRILHLPSVVVRVNGKLAAILEKEGATTYWIGESLHDYLNRSGAEGWRVVGAEHNFLILEREKVK